MKKKEEKNEENKSILCCNEFKRVFFLLELFFRFSLNCEDDFGACSDAANRRLAIVGG